jgi:hypothetical protein
LSPESIPDDIYPLFFDSEVISTLEAYREKIDRQADYLMTPDRAYWLAYTTTIGTEAEKTAVAAQAAFHATPLEK